MNVLKRGFHIGEYNAAHLDIPEKGRTRIPRSLATMKR